MALRWRLPRVTPPKMDPREVQAIDETVAAWLIEATQGTRLYLPILLTTCTGIRRGRHAVRGLRKVPVLSAVAIASLALGSGQCHCVQCRP